MNRWEPTPGPWEEVIDDNGLVYVVGPENGQEELPGGEIGHTDYVCYIGDMETTTGKDHANAALIKAGPDLLAACKKLIEAEMAATDEGNFELLVEATEMAHAAIARVEGDEVL